MNVNEILVDLRAEQARIEIAIAALEALNSTPETTATPSESSAVPTSKRRLSAAGRRRIAEAARKRWATLKAAEKTTKIPAKKSGRKPMSPAAKKRLSDLAKKRWAARKISAAKA